MVATVEAWKHANFLCRNYILNGLDNILYNVYSPIKTAKELWESLEKKYKTDDVGSKKFVVGKFLDFVMIDFKTVVDTPFLTVLKTWTSSFEHSMIIHARVRFEFLKVSAARCALKPLNCSVLCLVVDQRLWFCF